MKWKRRESLLFAAPLLLLVIPFFSSDALDRKLRALAGPDAVNCGVVSESDAGPNYDIKGDAMDVCADAAYNSGRPFYMKQWVHMDGIKTTIGIVHTPEGKVLNIVYGVPRAVPFFIGWAAETYKVNPEELIVRRKGQAEGPKKRYWLLR